MTWPTPLRLAAAAAITAIAAVVADEPRHACEASAFRAPGLFGAEFGAGAVAAARVEAWKVNATYPETKLYPEAGMDLCNVTVTYGHPGQNDSVLVQVLLPDEWNGRFAASGGGGFAAGNIDGAPMISVLALGYATAMTDAGHNPRIWSRAPWVLKSKGNLDYPLLYNFASLSIHEMAVIGKDVATQYYGRAPTYSYFSGCSTGGRQGVTSAFTYPDDFDGILAGAPALNLPDLTISGYWAQFVMDRLGAYPTKCEMDAINNASVAACDALDGVRDGVLADPDACAFDPQTLVGRTVRCHDANDTSETVSPDAARVAAAIRSGPASTTGRPLFVGAPHGTPFTGTLAVANTNCTGGPPCVGQPFPMAVDWIKLLLRRDPEYNVTTMSLRDLEEAYGLGRQFLGPIIGAADPDLSRFRAAGGGAGRRMITWHGLADECITARSSRLYYDRVVALDPGAKDYYRHFEAPGVNHCGVTNPGHETAAKGAFYPLRALDALVRWVEGGIAPDVLTGFRLGDQGSFLTVDPNVTRPLCMYPDVLRYVGGDPEAYGSFRCAPKTGGSPTVMSPASAATGGKDEL